MSGKSASRGPALIFRPEVRSERADYIFAAMLAGRSYQQIALKEGIGVRRVQQIVRETLAERQSSPAAAWRDLQIGRLQNALSVVESEIAKGKITAVPYLIRVMRELQPLVSGAFNSLPPYYVHEGSCEEFEAVQSRIAASRQAIEGDGLGPQSVVAKPNEPQVLDNTQNREIFSETGVMESKA